MKRSFALEQADAAFFLSAPIKIVHAIESNVDTENLWRALTADDALVSWARGLTRADWTSTRPFGVGSTRLVEAAGGVASLKEKFFRWDEGTQMSFYVEAASLPGFRKFAEDVLVQQIPGGSRLTWTFAVEPQRWFSPALTLSRPVLQRVTKGWAQGAIDHARQGVRR